MAKHLSRCQPCRRDARLQGLDDSLFETPGPAQRIAALLPLPFLPGRGALAIAGAGGGLVSVGLGQAPKAPLLGLPAAHSSAAHGTRSAHSAGAACGGTTAHLTRSAAGTGSSSGGGLPAVGGPGSGIAGGRAVGSSRSGSSSPGSAAASQSSPSTGASGSGPIDPVKAVGGVPTTVTTLPAPSPTCTSSRRRCRPCSCRVCRSCRELVHSLRCRSPSSRRCRRCTFCQSRSCRPFLTPRRSYLRC